MQQQNFYFAVLKQLTVILEFSQTYYANLIINLRTDSNVTLVINARRKKHYGGQIKGWQKTKSLTVSAHCVHSINRELKSKRESGCELKGALIHGVFICRGEMGQKIYALFPPSSSCCCCGEVDCTSRSCTVYVVSGLSGFLPFPQSVVFCYSH